MARTWSLVRAVPQLATTFLTPAAYTPMTSMYPSTRTARSFARMALFRSMQVVEDGSSFCRSRFPASSDISVARPAAWNGRRTRSPFRIRCESETSTARENDRTGCHLRACRTARCFQLLGVEPALDATQQILPDISDKPRPNVSATLWVNPRRRR